MTPEERRTVLVTAAVLLLASLARMGWEARPVPPLLPPDTSAYASLLEETDSLIDEEARRSEPLAPGERIDPNRASEVELDRLPGVGPALAGRIAASRDAEGPFRRPEDLGRVSGIGDATLARLRDLVDVSDPPPGGGSVGRSGGPVSTRSEGIVDVNRASVDELESLPGIGPALAGRIVEARRGRGRFRTVDELIEVPGIGPAVLERIRARVAVR